MVKISNAGKFVKAITCDNIGAAVSSCYDEIMVLYYILNGREDIEIQTHNLGTKPASFILLMDSEEAASKLASTMNGMSFSAFGDLFDITMKSSSASVYVTIERASG